MSSHDRVDLLLGGSPVWLCRLHGKNSTPDEDGMGMPPLEPLVLHVVQEAIELLAVKVVLARNLNENNVSGDAPKKKRLLVVFDVLVGQHSCDDSGGKEQRA